MTLSVVKGITLTPPVIGRITMGHTVVRGDKAMPVKDDHFSLTTLVQNKTDRSWGTHPLQAQHSKGKEKLRAIPVRIAYNDLGLNLNNSFSAFDSKTGRVLCVGDGCRAKRATVDGVKEIDCPKPEGCDYAAKTRCKNMSRAYFRIEGQEDELGVFILRTTSYNSLNYLGTRLAELHGLTGGRIAGMPMMLVMESKSTTQSFRDAIHFADLVTRPGMSLLDAVKEANAYQKGMVDAGLSLDGMETALVSGLANSDFADDIEDVDEWISDDDLARAAEAQRQPASPESFKGMMKLTEQLGILSTTKVEPDAPAPAVEEESGAPAEATA